MPHTYSTRNRNKQNMFLPQHICSFLGRITRRGKQILLGGVPFLFFGIFRLLLLTHGTLKKKNNFKNQQGPSLLPLQFIHVFDCLILCVSLIFVVITTTSIMTTSTFFFVLLGLIHTCAQSLSLSRLSHITYTEEDIKKKRKPIPFPSPSLRSRRPFPHFH
jgi:hypothetical protein